MYRHLQVMEIGATRSG